jgi:hypothetical protein
MASTEIDALVKSILSEQQLRVVENESPTEGHRVQPVIGTLVDHSGTITVANQSQLVMKENHDRRYLLLVNTSDNTLWFNFSLAAQQAAPSIPLAPGSFFVMEHSFVSFEAVNIVGPAAGLSFVAKEG